MRKYIVLFKRSLCLILVFVLFMQLTGCGKGSKREYVLTTAFEKNEIMRINTVSCFLPEFMLYLTTVKNQYEAVYGKEIWERQFDGESLETKIKDQVIEKVARVKVMNLMAETYGLTLSDEEKLMVEGQAAYFYGSLNDKEKELIGVSLEDIERIYTEYAMAGKVYDYVIRDINPEISDDEARTISVLQIQFKTYKEDKDGNRISLSDADKASKRAKAEEIYAIAVNEEESADFEALAAEYNEGDEIKYTFGRGEMAEAFEEVAFSLDEGEISNVIETEAGYHIIKCISVFNVDETQENKIKILEERKEAAFTGTYDEFVLSLTKNLNRELFDSISMITDEEVTTSDFFDVNF